MGLFSLFKSKTPPPLYMHGDPDSPNCFLSPIPSATDPPPNHRRRLSHYTRTPESQRRFVLLQNPREATDMGRLREAESSLLQNAYSGSQRGLSMPEDSLEEDAYSGSLRSLRTTRKRNVRRGIVDGLSPAQARRRAAMYYRERRVGFQQRPRRGNGERGDGYGPSYQASEHMGYQGMGSWGYPRSLGAPSTGRGTRRLEGDYSTEGSEAEEEGRPRVGVFGVANPPYGAPRGRGRGVFRGGRMGVGGRGFMHGRGPFN